MPGFYNENNLSWIIIITHILRSETHFSIMWSFRQRWHIFDLEFMGVSTGMYTDFKIIFKLKWTKEHEIKIFFLNDKLVVEIFITLDSKVIYKKK